MTISVEIPDGIIEGPDPGRAALEALALTGYRSEALSQYQARVLLSMGRLEFEEFLAVRGVHEFAYDAEALAQDLETMRRLKAEGKLAA